MHTSNYFMCPSDMTSYNYNSKKKSTYKAKYILKLCFHLTLTHMQQHIHILPFFYPVSKWESVHDHLMKEQFWAQTGGRKAVQNPRSSTQMATVPEVKTATAKWSHTSPSGNLPSWLGKRQSIITPILRVALGLITVSWNTGLPSYSLSLAQGWLRTQTGVPFQHRLCERLKFGKNH